jgi:hypothetical protein
MQINRAKNAIFSLSQSVKVRFARRAGYKVSLLLLRKIYKISSRVQKQKNKTAEWSCFF